MRCLCGTNLHRERESRQSSAKLSSLGSCAANSPLSRLSDQLNVYHMNREFSLVVPSNVGDSLQQAKGKGDKKMAWPFGDGKLFIRFGC